MKVTEEIASKKSDTMRSGASQSAMRCSQEPLSKKGYALEREDGDEAAEEKVKEERSA